MRKIISIQDKVKFNCFPYLDLVCQEFYLDKNNFRSDRCNKEISWNSISRFFFTEISFGMIQQGFVVIIFLQLFVRNLFSTSFD